MSKTNGEAEVKSYLDELDHPLKDAILEMRKIVLSADKRITEHIKWNAPSFCIDGDDRITMKLFPPKEIQLIFHRGAVKKTLPKEHLIADDGGLLKWITNDRAIVGFVTLKDLKSREVILKKVINSWIEASR